MTSLVFDPGTHTYTAGGVRVPHVTGILKAAGLIDERWYQDWHRDRGTYVHRACQFDDEGDLDEQAFDPLLRPYLAAWRRFKDEARFEPELIEHQVYSAQWRFAGTIDRVGVMAGRRVIIDIKSGTPPPATAIQLAGYQLAYQHQDGELILGRLAVQLKPDGTYTVTEYRDASDREVFRAALTIAAWKEAHHVE